MTLTDADIAALSREAVDRKDPRLNIRIDPAASDDPYRFGPAAWTVHAGGASSYVTATMSWQEALDKLVADLAG